MMFSCFRVTKRDTDQTLRVLSNEPNFDVIGSVHLYVQQIVRGTKDFSSSMLIGSGSFGEVYKAELPDGQVVAVKRAKKGLTKALEAEFEREVELLSEIDHRNLVKLIAYIEKNDERLIITEYVSNGNLREHLDGVKPNKLDFNQRLEIAIDIAHGLTYLHMYSEKQIIHRSIKSSNILLTDVMRAKVADFGFARLIDETVILTRVKGSLAYLDPEYMQTNRLTSKSDVYAYGILLLEILTGRHPIDIKRPPDERLSIRWAFKNYNEGRIMDMVDPIMNERVDDEVLMKMFGLVIQCAAPMQSQRPDMKTVVEQLWRIRSEYLERK